MDKEAETCWSALGGKLSPEKYGFLDIIVDLLMT
jgi:hypothetical protein